MADCFGLYPHISNFMINDPFNKRTALCRQMYDHFYCNLIKMQRLNLVETQAQCDFCLQQQAETHEHVLYCTSQLHSLYRRHVFSDMLTASQDITDKYLQMFTRNIPYLLIDSEGENKDSLWMGRPTLLQLKCLEQDMNPHLALSKPEIFIRLLSRWYLRLIHDGLSL